MNLGYMLLGFIIGVIVAGGGSWLLGAVGGVILGLVFARLHRAEQRMNALEAQLRDRQPQTAPAEAVPAPVAVGPAVIAGKERGAQVESTYAPAAEDAIPDEAWPEVHVSPATAGGLHAPAHPEDHLGGFGAGAEPAAAEGRNGAGWAGPEAPSRPSLLEVGLRRAAAWFTTGNVPVKVGVVLSFIGVSFLLKYAIDRELLALPIEFRLLAVAAGALTMLVLGWRLRHRAPVYALSLQGGGAGILFLTIFAAYRIWALIPAPLAFVLLVALAAATGTLAVLQSSRTLIVLGATGGFLAPVLASTGQGSHVALFSYYLVLNATILGVAWFRAWRELNLVGFVFTFVIGSLWGYHYYRPELFASTEPFLVLHFLFYNAIAILYALRQAPQRAGLVDGTLVFGTPVIAFALQAALMRGSEYGLAISAAIVALFYAGIAVALFRRRDGERNYLRLLTESYLSLAVAFATLAIPLALDARWTSAAWALEGAALTWIGTRQGRRLATLAGAALIGFSGIAFLDHGWRHGTGWPLLNANALGGALISLSALFAARRLESFDRPPLARLYPVLAWALFAWGVLWWLGTGWAEIGDRLADPDEMHAVLSFFALTALASAVLGVARDWSKARALTLLYLPGLLLAALAYLGTWPNHFLFGAGWPAWFLAFAVQGYVLRRQDADGSRIAAAWHGGSVLFLAAFLSLEAAWQADHFLAGDWDRAAASAMPGLIALLVLRLREAPSWPVPAHPLTYRGLIWTLVAAQAAFLACVSIDRPGDPAPFRYLPVLNPFDLAALFALLTASVTLGFARREGGLLAGSALAAWRRPFEVLLGAAFFVITTAALVRGVHHVSGVPWRFDPLFDSEVVQTALSIYWGLLGFFGMIAGARKAQRPLWFAGAAFMALTVAKLFLVDLGNSGTLERIISFIGIGVLLLVVGWFAPVPPRRHDTAAATSGGTI